LAFHFDRSARTQHATLPSPDCPTPGCHKEAIVDAVYNAYFEGGQDIGDLELLVSRAAAQGLDAEQIRALLRGDAARDQVLADAAWAQARGVRGVPYFVVDNRLAFSGAQPPEVILRILRQAAGPDEGEERE
jgi:predicted DsbA family dithiol-disulfide isomerase